MADDIEDRLKRLEKSGVIKTDTNNAAATAVETEPAVSEQDDSSALQVTVDVDTADADVNTNDLSVSARASHEKAVVEQFLAVREQIEQSMQSFQTMLANGQDPKKDVRPQVIKALQTFKVPHMYAKLDEETYEVKRPNNGLAADRILSCLESGEDIAQTLNCVYGNVFGVLNALEDTGTDAAATELPADVSGLDLDPEEEADQWESYLEWLAAVLKSKTLVLEVDGKKVIAPSVSSVRLHKANNGTWCFFYDTIYGPNPEKVTENGSISRQLSIALPDEYQQVAKETAPDDAEAVVELLRLSAPRGANNVPKHCYPLMTSDSARELKGDIARALNLSSDNPLLGWFWREFVTGAGPSRLRELLAQKQQARQANSQGGGRPKSRTSSGESLRARRPSSAVASVIAPPAGKRRSSTRSVTNNSAAEQFIRERIAELTPEQAKAQRASIIAAAEALFGE